MQKRRKVTDRKELSIEEKDRILEKSDRQCCHCGKRIEIGGQFTVEHIIPIAQGGTNDDANMVALCKSCNESKSSRMVSLLWYPYLKREFYNESKEYVDAYHKAHGKVGINYFDKYDIIPFSYLNLSRSGMMFPGVSECYKAYYSDLDDIYRFYLRYCRDMLIGYSKDDVKSFITSCFQYGAIYFTRERYGDIACVLPLVPMRYGKRTEYGSVLAKLPATKYKKFKYYTMLKGMLDSVESNICEMIDAEFFQLRLHVAYRDNVLIGMLQDNFTLDGVYRNYKSPEILEHWYSSRFKSFSKKHAIDLMSDEEFNELLINTDSKYESEFSKRFRCGVNEPSITKEDLKQGVGIDAFRSFNILSKYNPEDDILTFEVPAFNIKAYLSVGSLEEAEGEDLDTILAQCTLADIATSCIKLYYPDFDERVVALCDKMHTKKKN